MATKKQPRLTLHYLLGALSYWGTSVRVLLMAFLAAAVLTAHLIADPSSYDVSLRAFIYIVGSFFLLDAGYVMLARAMPGKKSTDMTALLLTEVALGVAYIVPNFAVVPGLTWLSNWALLIAIFVLSIRALLGFLFANTRK
jgi:uncharacterized membrane protein